LLALLRVACVDSIRSQSESEMKDLPKNVVILSMAVAGVVALLALADLIMKVPFGGEHTFLMDILFLVSAGIVGYLGWDAYKDLT